MAQSQATNTGVIEMSAEARTPGTKNVARRLRASGRVPAILYGSNKDALALSMDPKLKVVSNPDQVVAHIITIKEEEVKAPEEVAGAVAAAPTEPEVIKKGKKEVEGEEGEAAAPAKGEPKAEKKK